MGAPSIIVRPQNSTFSLAFVPVVAAAVAITRALATPLAITDVGATSASGTNPPRRQLSAKARVSRRRIASTWIAGATRAAAQRAWRRSDAREVALASSKKHRDPRLAAGGRVGGAGTPAAGAMAGTTVDAGEAPLLPPAQLLQLSEQLYTSYDSRRVTVDSHAESFLGQFDLCETDRIFAEQVLYGCVRYRRMLDAFLNALYHKERCESATATPFSAHAGCRRAGRCPGAERRGCGPSRCHPTPASAQLQRAPAGPHDVHAVQLSCAAPTRRAHVSAVQARGPSRLSREAC